MTPPTAKDGSRFDQKDPSEIFAEMQNPDGTNQWCYASLQEVQSNHLSTGYPKERIRFVKGPAVKTIPDHAPEQISLLRLDTDFYESSKHELVHLFPRLVSGGVLITDDYGQWEGQRHAVDEYLAQQKIRLLLKPVGLHGTCGGKIVNGSSKDLRLI